MEVRKQSGKRGETSKLQSSSSESVFSAKGALARLIIRMIEGSWGKKKFARGKKKRDETPENEANRNAREQ